MKAGLEEVKKVNTEEVKVLGDQMNEFKEILFAVYKDKLPAINAKWIQANDYKAFIRCHNYNSTSSSYNWFCQDNERSVRPFH